MENYNYILEFDNNPSLLWFLFIVMWSSVIQGLIPFGNFLNDYVIMRWWSLKRLWSRMENWNVFVFNSHSIKCVRNDIDNFLVLGLDGMINYSSGIILSYIWTNCHRIILLYTKMWNFSRSENNNYKFKNCPR
jgi:hypothetical protein